MDSEKIKRRQNLKVIVSEIIMVLTVIATVVILAFLVSGYWINSDFKVERQGLLQISSIPTGADVYIDGDSSWLQRTDTSKVLASGEHSITLAKDGYDSWAKTINISEGLVYRIHYPRLFLQNSSAEDVFDVSGVIAGSFSPDRTKLLLVNDTDSWQLLNLEDEQVKSTAIEVAELLSSRTSDEEKHLSASDIASMNWDSDGSHLLAEFNTDGSPEWIIFDINNTEKSLNLNKEFGSNFTDMMILDSSASSLLAVSDGNLRKIDVSGRSISSVLVENIVDYDHYGSNEVVFSAEAATEKNAANYYIGYLRLNDNKITHLLDTNAPANVAISRFYDSKYITILQGNEISVYKKDDFEKINTYELSFAPENFKIGHDGEFAIMSLGSKMATLDMEAQAIREWDIDSGKFGWIDSDMMYSIADGSLVVYDFDGLNRRIIAENATDNLPATISGDKWLYYFNNNRLMRKIIAD